MTGLTLPAGTGLEVIADADGWRLAPRLAAASDGSADPALAASRWLVEQLTSSDDPPLEKDFQVVRLDRTPNSPPPGDRVIAAGRTNQSVVLGEQMMVRWLRRMDDGEPPALAAVRQLDEVGFDGVPATYGALTWRSPSEQVLACAFVTEFLAGAVDGWQWCVAAVETGDRADFPAELGLLTARLHLALGTPSRLMPLPMLAVGGAQIRGWHASARQRLAELAGSIGELDDAPAGPDGRPRRRPADVLAEHAELMRAVIDRLLEVPGRTPVQLIHGDLHVGQMLSRPGNPTVIDFDSRPVLGGKTARHPAARDVAQMLLSLDRVARIVDRRSGFTRTQEIAAWSILARSAFLAAYQGELERAERRDVLDTRLLPAFVVDQISRDLRSAGGFRPSWASATIDGLETILNDLPVPIPREKPDLSVATP